MTVAIIATATAATFHDREWWRTEGRRVGTNWRVVLALHTAAVPPYEPDYTSSPMTVYPTCGAAACVNPSFCAACRGADRRRTRSRHIDTIPHDWESMSINALGQRFNERCPTPQSTIEAIMYCVRKRGLDALKEPANLQRLSSCDAEALTQIDQRITKFKERAADAGVRNTDRY
jgi:hypothetical protein